MDLDPFYYSIPHDTCQDTSMVVPCQVAQDVTWTGFVAFDLERLKDFLPRMIW